MPHTSVSSSFFLSDVLPQRLHQMNRMPARDIPNTGFCGRIHHRRHCSCMLYCIPPFLFCGSQNAWQKRLPAPETARRKTGSSPPSGFHASPAQEQITVSPLRFFCSKQFPAAVSAQNDVSAADTSDSFRIRVFHSMNDRLCFHMTAFIRNTIAAPQKTENRFEPPHSFSPVMKQQFDSMMYLTAAQADHCRLIYRTVNTIVPS